MGISNKSARSIFGWIAIAVSSLGSTQGSGTALDYTTLVLVDGLSLARGGTDHTNDHTTYQLQLGDVVTAAYGANAPYTMILPDTSIVMIPAGTQFRVESDDRGVETYSVLRGTLYQFRGALNPGKTFASREFGLESDRYTTNVPNQFADTLYSHSDRGSVRVTAGNVRVYDPYQGTYAMMSGDTNLYASQTYRNRIVVARKGQRIVAFRRESKPRRKG